MPSKNNLKLPLSRLGEDWTIPDELLDNLEEFTCNIYGQYQIRSVNELRYNTVQNHCEEPPRCLKERRLDIIATLQAVTRKSHPMCPLPSRNF